MNNNQLKMVAIYYDGLPCEYENEEVKYKGYILFQKCTTCKKQKTIQIKKNGWSYNTCKDCRLKSFLQRQKKKEYSFF